MNSAYRITGWFLTLILLIFLSAEIYSQRQNSHPSDSTFQSIAPSPSSTDAGAGYNQMLEERYFQYLKMLAEPRERKGLFGFLGGSQQEFRDFQITELRKYLEMFPPEARHDHILLMLGDIHRHAGDHSLALASYLKQLILFPESGISSETQSKLFSLISQQSSLRGHKQRISDLLNQGIPDDTYQHRYFRYLEFMSPMLSAETSSWYLNELYNYLERFPEASNADQIYLWTADIYQKNEQYEKAVLTYTKLQYVTPESEQLAYSYLQAGRLYRNKLNDYEKAVNSYQMLAREATEDSLAIHAYLMAGKLYAEELEENEKALEAYRQVTSRFAYSPKAINAYFAQSQIYLSRLNQPYKAIDHYKSVLENYPKYKQECATALRNIGDIYRDKIRDYFSAVESYTQLAEQYPTHTSVPDRLLTAGDLAANELNDNNRALQLYQRLVENYPDTREANRAKRRIDQLQTDN